MNISKHFAIWPDWNLLKAVLIILSLYSFGLYAVITKHPQRIPDKDKLTITGSEFYQRSQFDTGELRIFLKNTSMVPLSISKCKLQITLPDNDKNPNEPVAQVNYLYSKLSPPVLMPSQDGELLIKLLKVPPNNEELKCSIHDNAGKIFQTTILVKQSPLWVSYVGFSEDLRKVYIYVQNNTQNSLKMRLLEVAGVDVGNEYQSINNVLPAADKGCLIFELPTSLTLGEYVHVAVLAASEDKEWRTQRIVRAVNKFPLLFEESTGGSEFGIDSERFYIASTFPTNEAACIQSMVCPAHAHGTYEEASKKFLDNYYSVFSQNPYLLTMIRICRSDKPRAWYKFGALADISGMNPILLIDQRLKSQIKFNPFLWNANTAKMAAEPNRYIATILLYPEKSEFLQSFHTPDEFKFLVHCAIASGAKGILYRGKPDSEQLSRDCFIRVNKELQQLKPLLMIAEPVNWSSTADEDFIAKSLLCGDEAALVIVFDNRYFSEQKNNKLYTPAFQKSVNPVKIKVSVPDGVQICEVKSLYSSLPNNLWQNIDSQLVFTANMIDSIQVYKLILKRKDD